MRQSERAAAFLIKIVRYQDRNCVETLCPRGPVGTAPWVEMHSLVWYNMMLGSEVKNGSLKRHHDGGRYEKTH